MLTEKQANEKWCPFARTLGTLIGHESAEQEDRVIATGAANRGYQMGLALHNCRCIASQCMAWRWLEPPGPQPADKFERDDRGYCGLAGKP